MYWLLYLNYFSFYVIESYNNSRLVLSFILKIRILRFREAKGFPKATQQEQSRARS